jgi:hypothetical protein
MDLTKSTEDEISRPFRTTSGVEMAIMAASFASANPNRSNRHAGKYLPQSAAKILARKSENRRKNKLARKARKKNR